MEKKNPENKTELLQFVEDGRHDFIDLINSIPKERLEEKGVETNWSVKDILAHITAWETKMSNAFTEILHSDEPPDWPTTLQAVDQLNANFYDENKDKPLTQVLVEFEESYPKAITAIKALSEDDLFDPDRFYWRQGRALWETAAGNTFGHYMDHIPNIQAWLNQR